MPYQPLEWTQDMLLAVMHDPPDSQALYQSLVLSDVERCSVDRLVSIIQDIRANRLVNPRIADLGCSGGFFSIGLAVTVAAHVTAVDDDRYIDIQSEVAESSTDHLVSRIARLGIDNVSVIRESVETFVTRQTEIASSYDVVLLLNVLHHLVAGYGRLSEVGRLDPEQYIEFLKSLGQLTGHLLYLESNSTYFKDYEAALTDLMLYGDFESLVYVCHSVATDGGRRIVWRLSKRVPPGAGCNYGGATLTG